jgi:hypothetical protein
VFSYYLSQFSFIVLSILERALGVETQIPQTPALNPNPHSWPAAASAHFARRLYEASLWKRKSSFAVALKVARAADETFTGFP